MKLACCTLNFPQKKAKIARQAVIPHEDLTQISLTLEGTKFYCCPSKKSFVSINCNCNEVFTHLLPPVSSLFVLTPLQISL